MTFINDIFINLNEEYFEFYEWNKKDYIEHLKKTPIIKITNNDLTTIIDNKVIIKNEFITEYANKCEKYNNKNYNYIALTDGCRSIVVLFNKKGNILKKSSLIFEDEENICLLAKELDNNKIIYKVNKKYVLKNFTRLEKERIKYILKNIKKISCNCLKYLYYDCFNKEENDIHLIINTITNELKKDNSDIYIKCNNLFNIIYQQNK